MNEQDAINLPFVAIGNEELGEKTEVIDCKHCGQQHPIEYGTSRTLLDNGTWSEPEPSSTGFYKCGDDLYLGTINGKRWK